MGEVPAGHGVFRFPQALAYSPGAWHVFVGDQYSSVVQQFARDGRWERDIAFRADARQPGRIGVVGGLAADRNGHLFVVDSENDRVQVFAMAGGRWLASFGSHGTEPGRFDLGANTGAGGIALYQPDPSVPAVVYIADQYNHRIQRFTLDQATSGGERVLPAGPRDPVTGAVVSLPAPDRVWGQFGSCCSPDGFNYPQGIAVDAAGGRVFIADDRNHRVVQTDLEGRFITAIGRFGSGLGEFRFPYDVAVDARSPRQLYVADNINQRVQAFDAESLAFVGAWGSFGQQLGDLRYVRALGALSDDPAGGVAATDTAGNRVVVFGPGGELRAGWGIAGRGPGYFTGARGVAVDRRGAVAVADTMDARIARFDPDGTYVGDVGLISDITGFAYAGSADGQLDDPHGVAFDADGSLWIADTNNNRVAHVAADGAWLGATGEFARPQAVAVAPDRSVVVADTANNRVRRRDPASGQWSDVTLAGTQLDAPAAIAIAPDATMYVSDAANVYALAPGGQVARISPPAGTTWNRPSGLAADATALYVANGTPGSSAVLRRSQGEWTTVAGDGAGPGDVVSPAGLALGPGGTLFIADTGNNRIVRLDPPGATAPTLHRLTVAVNGLMRGTVTSAPAGIACPTDCAQRFGDGREVTLTASPAPGWRFSGWSGACTGTRACTVRLDDPTTVGASFATAPGA